MKPHCRLLIAVAFLINTLGPVPLHAQDFLLPKPGVRVHLSPEFNAPMLKGIKVHPNNPFRFDFILDKGDGLSTRGHVPERQPGDMFKTEQQNVSPSRLPTNQVLQMKAPQVNPQRTTN